MKSYSQFLNEAVEPAQKAWQAWLNSPAGVAAGKAKTSEEMSKAAKEFMRTFQKTGKAPGWATPGTSVKPPTGPSVKPPPPGATQAANQAARGSGLLSNLRGVAGNAWRATRPVRGLALRGLNVLNYPVIGDMIDPQGTSAYDQVTGPNAYYNAPGYKGPKPQPGQTLADIHRQAADQFKPKPAPKPVQPKPRSSSSTQGSTTNVTPPRPRTSSSTQGNTYAGGGVPNRSGTPVKPQPALTQQLGGLSIGPGGFNINGKPVKTTQTPPRPNPPRPNPLRSTPPRPQKSARQLELDAINADKSLSPMQKWAKANPKLAIAQKEKERIRGTVQSDNPLLKSRSGMRLGSSIAQDPKVQQLGKGYQRLANNPNTLRQKLGLKTK